MAWSLMQVAFFVISQGLEKRKMIILISLNIK